MFITDWICACVACLTADGREITEQQVTDMAETYAQSTYAAHIWLEHVRGIDPNSMFKALGDVVEVKAERHPDGALKGKLALFVKLVPHQDLIAMVRNGQKVHLSVEFDPNFAGSGKAYLVGVGVTDSPASLGVGVMKFSANERKQHLFSDPVAVNIKEQVNKDDDLKAIRSMLETLMLSRQSELNAPAPVVKDEPMLMQLQQQLDELKAEMERFMSLPSANNVNRPPATGGYYPPVYHHPVMGDGFSGL